MIIHVATYTHTHIIITTTIGTRAYFYSIASIGLVSWWWRPWSRPKLFFAHFPRLITQYEYHRRPPFCVGYDERWPVIEWPIITRGHRGDVYTQVYRIIGELNCPGKKKRNGIRHFARSVAESHSARAAHEPKTSFTRTRFGVIYPIEMDAFATTIVASIAALILGAKTTRCCVSVLLRRNCNKRFRHRWPADD